MMPPSAEVLLSFQGQPVTVIAQMKGKSTSENIERNFGMPEPEGYRKALRLMKQAEKFHRPIICFVDTPGAFCGMEAEERGQGEAIARNLYEMSSLETPILSVLIGEGGSGGALALAVGNEVWMMGKCNLHHSLPGRICIHPLERQQKNAPGSRRSYESNSSTPETNWESLNESSPKNTPPAKKPFRKSQNT